MGSKRPLLWAAHLVFKALVEVNRSIQLDSRLRQVESWLEQSQDILDIRDDYPAAMLRGGGVLSRQLDEALSMMAVALEVIMSILQTPTLSSVQRDKSAQCLANTVALILMVKDDELASQEQRDVAVRLFNRAREVARVLPKKPLTQSVLALRVIDGGRTPGKTDEPGRPAHLTLVKSGSSSRTNKCAAS